VAQLLESSLLQSLGHLTVIGEALATQLGPENLALIVGDFERAGARASLGVANNLSARESFLDLSGSLAVPRGVTSACALKEIDK
jgi:hypothetical protein